MPMCVNLFVVPLVTLTPGWLAAVVPFDFELDFEVKPCSVVRVSIPCPHPIK